MVTNQIVQLARDTHALGDTGGFGQQRARGPQFGIKAPLHLALFRLLARHHRGDEAKHGERGIEACLQKTKREAVLKFREGGKQPCET